MGGKVKVIEEELYFIYNWQQRKNLLIFRNSVLKNLIFVL